jgi:MarR family 2-MHQ and catechol resistance regulon transcriptional repressor
MGTHYRGTRKEVQALNAFIKLMRAAGSVSARLNRCLAADGLTLSQFGTLEALYHLGSVCQKVLGEKQLRTGGNITMVVDNLERNGLVQRKRSTDDRRYITVHLTPKGRKLIEDVFPRHLREIVREMSSLTEQEQIQLEVLCKKLGLQNIDQPAAQRTNQGRPDT